MGERDGEGLGNDLWAKIEPWSLAYQCGVTVLQINILTLYSVNMHNKYAYVHVLFSNPTTQYRDATSVAHYVPEPFILPMHPISHS